MFGKASRVSKTAGGHIQLITSHINGNKVLLYTKSTCPYCIGAKDLLNKAEVKFKEYAIDKEEEGNLMKQALIEITQQRTVPNIFINGRHIGGYSDLKELDESDKLKQMLEDAHIHNIL